MRRTSIVNAEMDDYFSSLDAALVAWIRDDNPRLFHRHAMMYLAEQVSHPTPHVLKVAAWKAATARRSLPLDVRLKAKRWLVANGFQSRDDGEITEPTA